MKLVKILVPFALLGLITGCGGDTQEAESHDVDDHELGEVTEFIYYGEEIEEEGGISVDELMNKMEEEDEVKTKVRGEIEEVCQKRGCWITLPFDDGKDNMRVRFKDYEFFLPKDIAGQEAVLEGKAYWDTTSVEQLRHYAEDAGKSEEEIEEIDEPEIQVNFTADGVVVKEVKKEAEEDTEAAES